VVARHGKLAIKSRTGSKAMTAITFDTLKYANTLKAAGVPLAQAEAEAVALSEVLEVNLKDLATKEDLLSVKNELHRDIEDVRRDMREMEQRLIIKLGALIALAIGIVAALVKLL
jgi:hypothetical protein